MQAVQSNLLVREDTLFGVCAALGEDFGFNPLWLRIAFAVSLLANPYVVGGVYAALAVVVLLSRLICPNPRVAAPAEPEAAPQPAEAAVEPVQELLPLAA